MLLDCAIGCEDSHSQEFLPDRHESSTENERDLDSDIESVSNDEIYKNSQENSQTKVLTLKYPKFACAAGHLLANHVTENCCAQERQVILNRFIHLVKNPRNVEFLAEQVNFLRANIN